MNPIFLDVEKLKGILKYNEIMELNASLINIINIKRELNASIEKLYIILDEKFPHECYNEKCPHNRKLKFEEAFEQAKKQFALEEFIKIWCSPVVKLYCCDCYKMLQNKGSLEDYFIIELENLLHEYKKKRIEAIYAFNDDNMEYYQDLRMEETRIALVLNKYIDSIANSSLKDYYSGRFERMKDQSYKEDNRIHILYKTKKRSLNQIKTLNSPHQITFKQIKEYLKSKGIKRSRTTKIKETLYQISYYLERHPYITKKNEPKTRMEKYQRNFILKIIVLGISWIFCFFSWDMLLSGIMIISSFGEP